MSLIATGIGIASGLFGGSAPPYSKSLSETNNAGKVAMSGDTTGLDTLQVKLSATKYQEVRAAARSWLTRLSLQGPSPEIRARAAAILASNGGVTLAPTSTTPAPGAIATTPVAGVPLWLLIGGGALVVFLLIRRR